MKKLFKLALVGTMVLVAAACQREPLDTTTEAPEAPEETGFKEVATQFVLNVAKAPTTKMSAESVQLNQNFRGMDNAKIYVYNTGLAPAKDAYVLKTSGWDAADYKVFDLGVLYSDGSVDNENHAEDTSTNPVTPAYNDNLANSSNRVLQLSIPVGSDAVLIYGKAIKGNNAKHADVGATNMDATKFMDNPDGTVIAARKILDTDTKVTQYDATASLMIYLINDILGMAVPEVTDELYGFPGHTYPVVHPGANPGDPETITYDGDGYRDLSWNALGHQYEIQTKGAASRYSEAAGFGMGRDIHGLEEVLGRCYFLFTDIKDGEYRTGSSGAVKRMIADMYKVIKEASDAIPSNEYEANAKRLAVAILNKAKKYFSIDVGGEYYQISELKTEIGGGWKAEWNNAQDLNGYPYEDFGVPRGAAQLAFFMEGAAMSGAPTGVGIDANSDGKNDEDVFYYLHPNKPLVNPNMASFEPRKYLYPAELWYYVNSPIRVTNKTDLLVSDYPDGVNPWKDEASWTADGWQAKGKVSSSTRGVAVKNSINYGVALLKTTVALPDAKYYDNRAALTDDTTDREIDASDIHFELCGVLVGGVNPRMNWQFTRKYTSTGNHENLGDLSLFDGVIYDSSIANKSVPSVVGKENYTLVYDNYNSSGDQDKVYIALEFKNLGDPFWGKHNLIPKDGYFYLVAEIPAPTSAQAGELTWPTDHQIPPVYGVGEAVPEGKEPGESKKIARVFMQDFMTSITFKLKQNSLKKAYYTMPDLRAAQMSLGLSVDLQWTPGLVYNDIVL